MALQSPMSTADSLTVAGSQLRVAGEQERQGTALVAKASVEGANPAKPTALKRVESAGYRENREAEANAVISPVFSILGSKEGRFSSRCLSPQGDPKPANPTGLNLLRSAGYHQIDRGEPNPPISIVFSSLIARNGRFSGRCMCLVVRRVTQAHRSRPSIVDGRLSAPERGARGNEMHSRRKLRSSLESGGYLELWNCL